MVTDLAAAGVPVTVSCRVLGLCRQQYYRWRAEPGPLAALVRSPPPSVSPHDDQHSREPARLEAPSECRISCRVGRSYRAKRGR